MRTVFEFAMLVVQEKGDRLALVCRTSDFRFSVGVYEKNETVMESF